MAHCQLRLGFVSVWVFSKWNTEWRQMKESVSRNIANLMLLPKYSGKYKEKLSLSHFFCAPAQTDRTHNKLIIYVIIHGPYLNSHHKKKCIFLSLSFHPTVSLSLFHFPRANLSTFVLDLDHLLSKFRVKLQHDRRRINHGPSNCINRGFKCRC